jgi:hypothetical protein
MVIDFKPGVKYPGKYDKRTIKFKAILQDRLPAIPPRFDAEIDLMDSIFPARMWGNDYEGCCVVATEANHSRVFEYIEQGHLINITDDDVHREYRRQTGGADTGLFMLDAMGQWRKVGWDVTGGTLNKAKTRGCWAKTTPSPLQICRKLFPAPTPPSTKQHLDIFAFAGLDAIDEIREAIFYLHGADIAVMLYQTDIDQFNAGEPWHLTGNDGEQKGGHAVYLPAYADNSDLECWSWKRRQRMTEDWLWKRQYHLFGTVDNRNKFMNISPVDPEKMNAILQEITG